MEALRVFQQELQTVETHAMFAAASHAQQAASQMSTGGVDSVQQAPLQTTQAGLVFLVVLAVTPHSAPSSALCALLDSTTPISQA